MGEHNPNPTYRGRNRCDENNGRWTGDNASYFAVHLRLKHFRGPASCYDCVSCGRPARQWAYDKRDAGARLDAKATRSGRPLEYSVRLYHYMPLCHRCHVAFDGTSAGPRELAKTHCPQGHPYNDVNTSTAEGHRRCLVCLRDRARARWNALTAEQREEENRKRRERHRRSLSSRSSDS